MLRVGNLAGPLKATNGGSTAPSIPLTGLHTWLKADTGTFTDTGRTTPASTNGAQVYGWEDQSGNAHHLSRTNGTPTLATNSQNGLPGITMTSADMDFPTQYDLTEMDLFIVWHNSDAGHIFHSTPNGYTYVGNSGSSYQADMYTLGGANSVSVNTLNGIKVLNFQIEATQIGIAYNDQAVVNAAHAAQTFRLQHFCFNGTTNGRVHEIVVYNRKLTGPERAQVLSYLNTRYAIY